jgi:WD40 repeat protein
MNHGTLVKSVAFGPDGKHVATASLDNAARVWDVTTGEQSARMSHDDEVRSVAFSPDGKYLATTSDDKTARVWLWRPKDLIDEACSRLTRNLTYDEWQRYLPDEAYRKTCPNLPIHPSFIEAGRDLTIRGEIEGGLAICNRAVELEPENGECHDARGLARALTGDYRGAIEDFEFYIEWARDKRPERLLSWRQEWIGELKAGRNPFDAATLEALRNE